MSQETVNHELQLSSEKIAYIHSHSQLSSAMHGTFERLKAANGEVVPVTTRDGAQGHFLHWNSPEQTFSELYLNLAPNAAQQGSIHQLSKRLIVETNRTCPGYEERRLRYHQYGPRGAECIIDVNPSGELQYESTSEIDALTADIDSLMGYLKLVERSL